MNKNYEILIEAGFTIRGRGNSNSIEWRFGRISFCRCKPPYADAICKGECSCLFDYRHPRKADLERLGREAKRNSKLDRIMSIFIRDEPALTSVKESLELAASLPQQPTQRSTTTQRGRL